MNEPVDSFAVLGKNDDRHTEKEILHVCGLLELEQRQAVVNQPAFDFGMGCRLSGVYVHVLQSSTVTGDDVEQLILTHHFVDAYHLDDIKREALLEKIRDLRVQAWITSTNPDLFSSLKDEAQFWQVKNNAIVEM